MRSGERITSFKDEIEKNQVNFIIQHNFLGGSLTYFSFKKNSTTGKVDLDLCSRLRNKRDKMKTFENCTHCGILFDGTGGTLIELTSEFSDYSFYLRCIFKQTYNLGVVVDSINRLIETVLNENQLIVNNLNQELCECQLSSSIVFPLC